MACKTLESTVVRELNRPEKASSKALTIGPELGMRLAALIQATTSTDRDSAGLEMTLGIEVVWHVDVVPQSKA